MLKLRASARGREVGLLVLVDVLEHDCDNVVADVSLALQLLPRAPYVGQLGRDVEHDLVALVDRVHRVLARCVGFKFFSTTKQN